MVSLRVSASRAHRVTLARALFLALLATLAVAAPATSPPSADAATGPYCSASYAPGTGCGGSFFELLRGNVAHIPSAPYGQIGAAALDNFYQYYGWFVVNWNYACHPYAGTQFLMPVIANFQPYVTVFMGGVALWGSNGC